MDQPLDETRRETWAALDRGRRGDVAVDAVDLAGPSGRPATYRIGDWMEHLGRRLRSDGATRRVGAADAVGRSLERAGEYLEHRQMAEIRSDAERVIVRRPVLTLALAAVVGYAAGRMLWR